MKNILNCSRTSRRWRKFLFRFASHELDDSSTRIRRIFKLSNTTRVVKILYIFFVLYLMALFSLLLCVVPGHIHYRLGKTSTHVECFFVIVFRSYTRYWTSFMPYLRISLNNFWVKNPDYSIFDLNSKITKLNSSVWVYCFQFPFAKT